MTHHPLLEALTHIDDKLIAAADQMPQKFHIPLPVWRAAAAVLVIVISLGLFTGIQHIANHQAADVHYIESRADFSIYGPEELVEEADVIYEGTVIDISFVAEKRSYGSGYNIDTIYTVAVTRTYKGKTTLIEQIHTGTGLQDYKLKEQLNALKKAGAPESYKSIVVLDRMVTPQIGSTYLFFLREWDDSPERLGINPLQYAMSGDSDLKNFDSFNPNVIKQYLPYVPHPLLIRTVIGGIVLMVFLTLRAKIKKKQRKTNE